MFIAEADIEENFNTTAEPNIIAIRQPVGCVGLCHWNSRDRVAEISFYIGKEQARGKGHCKRALRQLIDWGFRELDLALIYAEVYSFNEAGLKILEGLNFEKEGVLCSRVYRMGKRWDVIPMSLVRPFSEAIPSGTFGGSGAIG
jgi:RimJ/RimL family protein N-acetyltransferase